MTFPLCSRLRCTLLFFHHPLKLNRLENNSCLLFQLWVQSSFGLCSNQMWQHWTQHINYWDLEARQQHKTQVRQGITHTKLAVWRSYKPNCGKRQKQSHGTFITGTAVNTHNSLETSFLTQLWPTVLALVVCIYSFPVEWRPITTLTSLSLSPPSSTVEVSCSKPFRQTHRFKMKHLWVKSIRSEMMRPETFSLSPNTKSVEGYWTKMQLFSSASTLSIIIM